MLIKRMEERGFGSRGSEQTEVAGCCEHGSETSRFVNCGVFLNYRSNYRERLKKYSDSWTQEPYLYFPCGSTALRLDSTAASPFLLTLRSKCQLIIFYSFSPQSVLRQVRSFLQSDSPRSAIQCFLFQFAVSSSIIGPYSSCLQNFPRLPVTYNFFLYIFFNNLFQKAIYTQDVTNPVSIPPFYCKWDISILFDCM